MRISFVAQNCPHGVENMCILRNFSETQATALKNPHYLSSEKL